MKYQKQKSSASLTGRYSYTQKLFFLYSLNLTDWLCTEALLATGKFVEANPVMSGILGSFFSILIIKGILPLALTILCAVLFRLADIKNSLIAIVTLDFGIIAYSLLNLWHVFNFILLFNK